MSRVVNVKDLVRKPERLPKVGDRVYTIWRSDLVGESPYLTWVDVWSIAEDGAIAGFLQAPPNTTVPHPKANSAPYFANQRIPVDRVWVQLPYSPFGVPGTWWHRDDEVPPIPDDLLPPEARQAAALAADA